MITIVTNLTHRFNRSIDFGGVEIAFNQKGEAKVEKDVAEKMVASGTGFYYEADLPKKKQEPLMVVDKNNEDLRQRVITLEKEAAILEAKIQDSEEKSNKLELENENLRNLISELEKGAASNTDENLENDVEDLIKGKSKKELLVLCEEMAFPKGEYENLVVSDLRDYMLEKVRKG